MIKRKKNKKKIRKKEKKEKVLFILWIECHRTWCYVIDQVKSDNWNFVTTK